MSDRSPITVRPATRADVAAIARIYNEGIRGRGATFETRERTPDDIAPWFHQPRFPVLVAEQAGAVVGWAAASSYRARECYAGIADYPVTRRLLRLAPRPRLRRDTPLSPLAR